MRYLVIIHRWIGVGMCFIFSAWFVSGIVMIYQPFPSLSDDERLQRSEVISFETKFIPIHQHLTTRNEHPDKVSLISVLGEPYYWWHDEDQDRITTVHAVNGVSGKFDNNQIRKIAQQFHPDKPILTIQPPTDYDQWIVSNRFDPYRPFYRVEFDDVAKTNIYVSSRNAQVLQQTTQSQRRWNYIGAVVHWIYPTILRKHWAAWDQLVWWLALVGIVSATTGLVLGVIRTFQANKLWSSFEGWLKWHHLAGLIVGIMVLSWIFSGWLSMDHGRLFSKPNPTTDQMKAFNYVSLKTAAKNLPALDTIYFPLGIVEIELRVIAGEPYLLGKSSAAKNLTWILNAKRRWQKQENGLPHQLLQNAVKFAWPNSPIAEFARVEGDDIYTNLREGQMASSVFRIVLTQPNNLWIHVDGISGDIISVMDSGRRTYRWLFNGLHSFDFPFLTSRPLLWYFLILVSLGLGTLFSITGMVLGIRRLFGLQ